MKPQMPVPAFFSLSVISCQSTFIRSLNAIHKSACSCGGIDSHRCSMLVRVGFDMACALRCCDRGETTADARKVLSARVLVRADADIGARATNVHILSDGRPTYQKKSANEQCHWIASIMRGRSRSDTENLPLVVNGRRVSQTTQLRAMKADLPRRAVFSATSSTK